MEPAPARAKHLWPRRGIAPVDDPHDLQPLSRPNFLDPSFAVLKQQAIARLPAVYGQNEVRRHEKAERVDVWKIDRSFLEETSRQAGPPGLPFANDFIGDAPQVFESVRCRRRSRRFPASRATRERDARISPEELSPQRNPERYGLCIRHLDRLHSNGLARRDTELERAITKPQPKAARSDPSRETREVERYRFLGFGQNRARPTVRRRRRLLQKPPARRAWAPSGRRFHASRAQ